MENEIKVYINSAYLKNAFLVDIIGIPCCVLMLFGRSESISTGLDNTFFVRASGMFGIVFLILITIFALITYFSKTPKLIVDEKGFYKPYTLRMKNKEIAMFYSWSRISSINFSEEMVITLNDTEKTKLILFCNENEDVPVIRNQILSKFRDQIEFFNIQIIQK